MKKTMTSAYTDMMTNLAKSTAAIPLHLQPAADALAWWEQPDSLLAKAQIDETDELQKASAENETDEAYEEDKHHDEREESNGENDVHGGDGEESEGDDEEGEDESEEMEKSLTDPKLAWHQQSAAASDHNARMKFIESNPFPGTEREYHASRQAYEKHAAKKAASQLNKKAYERMAEYGETGDRTKYSDSIRLATIAKDTALGKAMADLDAVSTSMLEKSTANMVALGAAIAPAIPGIAMAAYQGVKAVQKKKAAAKAAADAPKAWPPGFKTAMQTAREEHLAKVDKFKEGVAHFKNVRENFEQATAGFRASNPVNKALTELDALSSSMLEKARPEHPVGDRYLKGQTELFPGMPVPSKVDKTGKPIKQHDQPKANVYQRGTPAPTSDLSKALEALDATTDKLSKGVALSPTLRSPIAASRGVTPLNRKMALQNQHPHAVGEQREELDRAEDQGVNVDPVVKAPSLIKK